jgi:FAD/FMN-containing dehydrogenase
MAEREADIEPNRIWMDESVAELRPHAKGHYINEIDPLRYPQHVAECFAPEDWKRLVDLRRLYDPDGVFHSYLGHDA